MDKKSFGAWAENLASRYLAKLGYKIIDRNWHCRFGELDIIAKKDGLIHFVEVKARRNQIFGWPEEAVTISKQQKLVAAIACYFGSGPETPWQLDLVIIEQRGQKYYWQLFENIGE
ncbi:MAG: YraN family protein [Candidatus Komeilibacteria bacterium]|nr:YraN family protein [Candidatus Komeilibacteria bacterium]